MFTRTPYRCVFNVVIFLLVWISCAVSGGDVVFNGTCYNTREDSACDQWKNQRECLSNSEYTSCHCMKSCANTVLCSNETDDFQCDCWNQAKNGKYELDPTTWSVNCSTSFAIRNSTFCSDPSNVTIPHADLRVSMLKADGVYRFLDQIKFDCHLHLGYTRSAYTWPTMTCNETGDWFWGVQAGPTTCVLIDCDVPSEYPTATLTYNATTYNQTAVYTCNDGTEVIAVCNGSGHWEFQTDFNTTCAPTTPGPAFVKRSGPTEAKGAEIIGAFGVLVMVAVVGSIIVLDCTSCPRHFSLGWRNTKRFRKWLNRKCPCRAPDNKTTAIEEIRGDSCAKPAQDDCTVIELEEPKPARTNIVTSKPKRAVLKTKQILSN